MFIDEWSTNFLDEDILKRLLQGKFTANLLTTEGFVWHV